MKYATHQKQGLCVIYREYRHSHLMCGLCIPYVYYKTYTAHTDNLCTKCVIKIHSLRPV